MSLKQKIILSIVHAICALLFGFIFFSVLNPKHVVNSVSIVPPMKDVPVGSSHSLTPVISNQWYSNLNFSFPSKPLYALPLAFQIKESGIGFSFPEVSATPKTVFAPYNEDFTIGIGDTTFEKPKIRSIGDWTLSFSLKASNGNELFATIGHGLPYAPIKINSDTVQATFTKDFEVLDTTGKKISLTSFKKIHAFIVKTHNHLYLFTFTKDISVSQQKTILTFSRPGQILVSLLDRVENALQFENLSTLEIVNSRADFTQGDHELTTSFTLETRNGIPLIALYPHQFESLTGKQDVIGEYKTLRGTLKLIKAQSFSTSVSLVIPSGTFTKLNDEASQITDSIKHDIKFLMDQGPAGGQDYFLGVWFGKASNLLLLADAYGLEKEKKQLLEYITPLFLKSLSGFGYQKGKTSVIAKKPEFGNERLNDHHFHYGYYVRTAAVLANFDIGIVPKIRDSINQFVADIATTSRDSEKYPFLRNFDVYEGHSWADGTADFADGNNQESSSEAVHAWYSVYLWSKVIKDEPLGDYSLALYNSEIFSSRYYWFNKNGIYSVPYNHAIASILWGGKVDFATWFSGETNMKYGIQLLPFTPASDYLGFLPDYEKYAADIEANNGGPGKEWEDLILMWFSFYKPEEMFLARNKITRIQDGNSRSLMLYVVTKNWEKYKAENPNPTPGTVRSRK